MFQDLQAVAVWPYFPGIAIDVERSSVSQADIGELDVASPSISTGGGADLGSIVGEGKGH
jgi:hypothetical protein